MAKDIFGNEITTDLWGNPLKSKNKRQPVSRSQKNEVLARQNNKCADCRKMLDMRATHFDHKKEVYKGGKSLINNLQALCAICHSKKTHSDKLKKVEERRKSSLEQPANYYIDPIPGKKVKSGSLW